MTEPPITLRAAHDSGPLAMPVTRIVVHATCPNVGFPAASAPGSAMGTARYFATPAAGGSAHYVEAVDGETHCVPDNVTAWHAPPNGNSIGVEICAEGGTYPKSYTRDQWLSPQVWPGVQRAAGRVGELCDRFGVPKVKIGPADLLAGAHGICGHVDVSQAWHQSDHSDPGPEFPWPEFLAAVNGTPGGFLMALNDDQQAQLYNWIFSVQGVLGSLNAYLQQGGEGDKVLRDTYNSATQARNLASQAVAAARGGAVDTQALATALAPAVIAAIGAQHGLSQADVEAAVRKVFADASAPKS